jgi:pilus assembly protein CpaF
MSDLTLNLTQTRPDANNLRTNGSGLRTGTPTARPLREKEQQELKSAVHAELINRLDLEKLGEAQETRAGQLQLFALIQQIIGEQGVPLSSSERDRLAQEVLDEVFGLGPLEQLLKDDTISDILVNTASAVYVERRGVLSKTSVTFPRQPSPAPGHRQDRLCRRPPRR